VCCDDDGARQGLALVTSYEAAKSRGRHPLGKDVGRRGEQTAKDQGSQREKRLPRVK
jgi:hypothetical protein